MVLPDSIVEQVRREQDEFIIWSAADAYPNTRAVLEDPRFAYLTESPPLEPGLDDQPVELPAIFLDSVRERCGIGEAFVDPPRIGSALPLREYVRHWQLFAGLTLSKPAEAMSPHALQLLWRCLQSAGTDHGYNSGELQSLVDRLWQLRWVLHGDDCAVLRYSVLAHDQAQLDELMAQDEEAYRTLAEFTRHLNHARESASSLDDWFEDLYRLYPMGLAAYRLFDVLDSEDARKQHRFVDEMCADIGTVFHATLGNAVLEQNAGYWSERYLLDPETQYGSDPRKLRRHLSYHCHGRVFYPTYWYELALEHVQGCGPVPRELDAFDHRQLVSLAITESLGYAEAFGFGLH